MSKHRAVYEDGWTSIISSMLLLFFWLGFIPSRNQEKPGVALMENNTKMMTEGADRLFRLSGVL
jgi:hypothetical protein